MPPLLSLTADPQRATKSVSRTLFGLFFEDINRSLDGGLNANMVANHSFDGVYLDRRRHNELLALTLKRRPRRVHDPLRHWHLRQGAMEARRSGALQPLGGYARVSTEKGAAVVENQGYQPADGGRRPAIVAQADAGGLFSCWLRTGDFDGALEVRLVAQDGTVLSSAVVPLPEPPDWRQVEVSLPPSRDARASLQIALTGRGHLDIDEVSLVSADHWRAGDPRWTQGKLRRDLVEALRDLYPTFMRFPGGCVVEGIGEGNAYNWKQTVGPLHTRAADFNLWALRTPDGDYSQSNQIGFYEYFLLCEDLGIAAMPVVSAGISCQFRSRQTLSTSSAAFAELRQDVLDLIDWATGDPDSNEWAALRAQAGHPAPFELPYIGLGNENHGQDYLEKFQVLRADVQARLPETRVVLSAGPFARGPGFDRAWAYANGQGSPLIVDEHFYKRPQWFVDNVDRYDSYPRGAATVFVGEYAAHPPTSGIGKPKDSQPNTFESALAEAAFLVGVVRNSDVVEMTSYAPLLNRVGTRNWDHNLIDFNPGSVMRTVNYEVQRLFAGHLGTRIVPIKVRDGVDGVFACSTASSDRQYVIMVNTTDAEVNAVLDLPASNGSHATAVVVSGDRDAANLLTFDGTPRIVVVPTEMTVPVRDGAAELSLPPRSVIGLTLDLDRSTT